MLEVDVVTIVEMKRHIFENGKIEFVLESLNCHNIKYNEKHEYFSAAFPDGDNPQGINIRNNEYLNYRSFSRGVSYDDGKDIIDLVQYITKKNFVDSIKYLHSILGLEYRPYKKEEKKKEEKKFDPLAIFKDVIAQKRRVNVEEIRTIEDNMEDEYLPLLHIDWFKDGIIEKTRQKFGLMYSYRKNRVIIPLRHWLTGDLMGVNERTTVQNFKELGIKKYFITPTYQKSLNLFGLYENYDDIQKSGYVVIFESERSVLKRHSLRCIKPEKNVFNYSNGVALSRHTISDEQVRILIGLNVEIVIALDKDIPIEEVRAMCERFYRIRNVSYVYDKHNLLDEKQSPADASNKIYNFLIKYRTRYDESEHVQYLKSLER